ncbi:MAG TPA: hypothetical protein VMR86_20845 [Myxococcota bacterium]|nr:hypothetical protein [Myxococcota bacterium]
MRRALTLWVTAVALAAPAAFAPAQSRPHVRDVRVGAHEGYQRVVVELDGSAEIAWQRGPEAGAEKFYLDADLGQRERVIESKLPQVGKIVLRAMRVGTQLELEPRERRLRAYLLAKPTRLVIDVAEPGEGKFEVPAGLTALSPAKSFSPPENAPVPVPEPEPGAEPEPEPKEAASSQPAPEAAQPEARAETPPEATAPETPPEAAAPEPAPPAPELAAEPEPAPAPEPPPAAEVTPPAAPPPAPPAQPEPAHDTGFPWGLALGTLAVLSAVGVLGFAAWRMRPAAPEAPFRPRPRPTPPGVDAISVDELRSAADPTSVLEQRLDQEVRARLALEERLQQAGEELKVLRDRVHRVERRREDAP